MQLQMQLQKLAARSNDEDRVDGPPVKILKQQINGLRV
jgi:hypothetical protein